MEKMGGLTFKILPEEILEDIEEDVIEDQENKQIALVNKNLFTNYSYKIY